jgi:GntR family transcriptional regulator
MKFRIVPSEPTPIYRQIVEQVRRQVAGGQLRPGDELPSVRSVAQLHAVNPMTVSKAYSLLEAEGVLERRRGMGMAIASALPRTPLAARLELLRPSLESAAQAARHLEISTDQALALFRKCLDIEQGGKP